MNTAKNKNKKNIKKEKEKKKKNKKKNVLIFPLKSETFLMITFVASCLPSKSAFFSVIGAGDSVN